MSSSQSINLQNLVIKLFSKLYDAPAVHAEAGNGRSLLITSARPGEGKTFISRIIAHHALQLSNEKVLLVDGNFENPQLHLEYNCTNQNGFSDCLGTQEWDKAVFHTTAVPGLTVLPAGSNCKPGLLFRKEPLTNFLRFAGSKFGIIIIDGAILKIGGNSLASQVDGVALVIDSSKTRREVIQGTMDSLHIDKGRYFGAILNKKAHYIPKFLYRHL